ncbi:MAG: hypothetical protein CMG35_03400 [Candidatus Marinimicrobia bacterium]|nr:hypothetical protein [Candidatus Neomarinimicrobiota bacterium]|tara:strand:+ start:530 stop:1039 length:510 start_codon:yes stop_codon:yes gene_type:complete
MVLTGKHKMNKLFVNEVPTLIAQHSDEPESTLYDINCTIGTNEVTMWRGLVKEAVLDRLMKDVNAGMYGGTAMVTVTRVIGEPTQPKPSLTLMAERRNYMDRIVMTEDLRDNIIQSFRDVLVDRLADYDVPDRACWYQKDLDELEAELIEMVEDIVDPRPAIERGGYIR